MIDQELQLRRDLAAAYRLIAHFGMSDLVYTHLSVRLPGDANRFLVNPYGFLFEEITASSLVEVDADGLPAQATSQPVNPAGFVIHSAIHRKRHDAACVMHTHSHAGMVVATQKDGILPLNQINMEFTKTVAIHPYEGIAADDNLSERERLVANLGDASAMILQNHGLLTIGTTVAEAFYRMYYLDQSCRIQIAAQATGAALTQPSAASVERAHQQYMAEEDRGGLVWRALVRKLDREQPDYRD